MKKKIGRPSTQTKEKWEKIYIERYVNKGLTLKQIANENDMDESRVCRLFQRFNLKRRKQSFSF